MPYFRIGSFDVGARPPNSGEGKERQRFIDSKPVRHLWPRVAPLVKDVAGTRQRNSDLSQLRQQELLMLRTLVTGLGPPLDGGGKPQRIIVRLRAPLLSSLMIGAMLSG